MLATRVVSTLTNLMRHLNSTDAQMTMSVLEVGNVRSTDGVKERSFSIKIGSTAILQARSGQNVKVIGNVTGREVVI